MLNITATEMSKITATRVAEESSDEATVRNVASHISYTVATFYQHIQGDERSVAVYTITNKNKRPLEGEREEKELLEMPHLKKGRKVWKEEEKDILIQHFGLTNTSKAPKQDDCETFLLQRDGSDGPFEGRTRKEVGYLEDRV